MHDPEEEIRLLGPESSILSDMTTPLIDLHEGSVLPFLLSPSSDHLARLYYVLGYDTPEECSAWFAGERTRFDEVTDWLTDLTPKGRVCGVRDDTHAVLLVGFESDTDAVMFRLRWSDVPIEDGIRPRFRRRP